MASYTEQQRIELLNTICDEIAEGRSLRKVLLDEGMPDRTTFFKWIDDNKERINQYTRACEARADLIFDETFEIADNTIEGTVIETDDSGRTKEKKGDMLGHRKLQIDTRRWALSKMQPKKYGDKLDLSSDDGSMTPQTNIITTLTPEQLKEALNK
jgi:hypothetical protein